MAERILLVRLGAFGDILHALPAAATVRANAPDAHICWIAEPRWLPLLEGNPHIDEAIPLDRASLSGLLATRRQLQARRFDTAIDFQGLIKSALTARASGAQNIFGYSRDEAREPAAALLYHRTFEPQARHVVERHIELAMHAAGPKRRIEFPIPPGREEAPLPDRFVLASPLAGWGSKQWPLERYSELGRLLMDRLGVPLVLNTAAPAPPLAATIPHVTGLAGLIDATRRALAVVGVDSGPLHLAAALQKPGVALFGPTDPARNGPYCDTITVLRDASQPVSYKREAAPAPGLAALGAARVLEALEASLRAHFQTR